MAQLEHQERHIASGTNAQLSSADIFSRGSSNLSILKEALRNDSASLVEKGTIPDVQIVGIAGSINPPRVTEQNSPTEGRKHSIGTSSPLNDGHRHVLGEKALPAEGHRHSLNTKPPLNDGHRHMPGEQNPTTEEHTHPLDSKLPLSDGHRHVLGDKTPATEEHKHAVGTKPPLTDARQHVFTEKARADGSARLTKSHVPKMDKSTLGRDQHTAGPGREIAGPGTDIIRTPNGIGDKGTGPRVNVENRGATPKFAALVQNQIDSLQPGVRRLMAEKGIHVVVGDTVTSVFPDHAKEKPRGWPPGSTWNNADGLYSSKAKTILVTEHRVDGKDTVLNQRAEGVAKHETGHAVDEAMGNFSQTEEFKKAYEADVSKFSKADRKTQEYLLQGNGAGKGETFAEVFGALNGASSNPHETREILSRFPNVARLLQQKIKEM